MHGDRTALPPLLEQERIFTRLPLAGFAVASVEYRLSSEACFPAQLEDVQAAIRWLRARHDELGIDPCPRRRLGRVGRRPSRGLRGRRRCGRQAARRASAFAEQPTNVMAVVDWYGPTDFAAMDRQAPANSMMCHDDPDSPESRLIGAPVQERPDLVARADPCRQATAEAPPFLIMHGTRDRWVPFGQIRAAGDAAAGAGRGRGLPAHRRRRPRLRGLREGPELVDEVVAFLVRVLRSPAARPRPAR